MSTLKIITYPNPILRKKARDIKEISSKQRGILENMAETMYENDAVGLAAEQVDLDTKLIVIDARDEQGIIKLINPVIREKESVEYMDEACLSLPSLVVSVPRAKKIKVEARNERGEHLFLEAGGFLARVLQHEIDHLYGKMIIDYLNPAQKSIAEFKYYMKKFFKK